MGSKKKNSELVIGIDHGYGFIKTAHAIMKSGVRELPVAPPFSHNLLEYKNCCYVVGQVRQNHRADKTENMDYYILTLAAIAEELKRMETNHAENVILSVGLPYSFMGNQSKKFKEYLLETKKMEFMYEGLQYVVQLSDIYVFPQGFPIIAQDLDKYSNKIAVVDVGSRTIDVLTFLGGQAQYEECFSIDKSGVIDCIEGIQNNFLTKYQMNLDENMIQDFLRGLPAAVFTKEQEDFLGHIVRTYVNSVILQLESKGVSFLTPVVFCGGGATVIEQFSIREFNKSNVTFNTDISANAKGYEYLCKGLLS